jgi:hypothetical protein
VSSRSNSGSTVPSCKSLPSATATGLERYRRAEQALFVHGTGPYWAVLVRERPGFEYDNQEDAWRRAATR